MNPKILIVDDEPAVRYALRALLEEEGFAVDEAPDGQAGLERVEAGGVDLVLSDLRTPKLDGMGLLDAVVARPRAPKVILITAHGNERAAVEAMKRGAIDYFAKPFDNDEIVRVVRRALETARLPDETRRLRAARALARLLSFVREAMRRVAERVERAAGRDVTVLITGETGTGKELVARALVRASARADRPYVRFNCAALTDSLAEAELFGHKAGAFTGAAKARPTAAHCCSTRWASWTCASRARCCARCRTVRSAPWAPIGPSASTCGWWPRPTATCAPRSRPGAFGRTFTTA